jgi:hypothetical protein
MHTHLLVRAWPHPSPGLAIRQLPPIKRYEALHVASNRLLLYKENTAAAPQAEESSADQTASSVDVVSYVSVREERGVEVRPYLV